MSPEHETPRTTGKSRAEFFTLAGLTLAAFALRMLDLDRFPLWEDEGATWWYSRLIADGRLMEGIRLEPTPPLYYLLVAAVTASLGDSDWAMRLPSVIFGAASIPVIFLLVRRLGRSLDPSIIRFAAWSAAALLAVHPLHVFYSREARVYPLLLLLTMLLWLTLRRALDDDATRSWGLVGGLLLVIAYCHYYSLFLFATAGLLVLVLAPDARRRWRGVAAVVLPGLLFLPYVVITLPHLRESGAAWSIDALYAVFPGDRSFLRVLEMGMLGADYPIYLREISVPPTASWLRWTAITVQVVLLALAVRKFVGRAEPSPRRRDLAFWLVAWLTPILLPWAVTHTFRAIFHPGRHDVFALWGLLFGVAVGLATLLAGGPRRKMVAALVGTLLLLAATGRLALLHAAAPNLQARERAEWMAPEMPDGPSDPGVVVWTLGIKRLLTERYLRLARPDLDEISISSFPDSTNAHPGWVDADVLMQDQDALVAEAATRVGELSRRTELVFVLTAGRPPEPDGGMTAQAWIDAALVRALERAGWSLDEQLTRRDLATLAFRAPH